VLSIDSPAAGLIAPSQRLVSHNARAIPVHRRGRT